LPGALLRVDPLKHSPSHNHGRSREQQHCSRECHPAACGEDCRCHKGGAANRPEISIKQAAKQSRYLRNVEPNEQEGYGGKGEIKQGKQNNNYGIELNEVGHRGLTWQFAGSLRNSCR